MSQKETFETIEALREDNDKEKAKIAQQHNEIKADLAKIEEEKQKVIIIICLFTILKR